MVLDTVNNGPTNIEYYKITSSVPGAKSGNDIEIDMTWEAVYGGVVTITPSTPLIDHCEAHPTFVDIVFSTLGSTAPVSNQFTIYKGSSSSAINTEVTKTGFYYDGAETVRIYYASQTAGTWISFALNYPDYTVANGTFKSTVA